MDLAYTVAQLRDAERAALARIAPGALMRQAAAAVVGAALAMLPRPLPGRRTTLLVGSGNNGGDALFAGATLARRGVQVTALPTGTMHPDGAAAFRRAGGRLADPLDVREVLARCDLVIDGLVGIGATPPLRPVAATLVDAVNRAGVPVVAVDVPSGIHPDTGAEDGPAITATRTVTFGAASTGLLASERTGRLTVAPLGLAPDGIAPDSVAFAESDAQAVRPRPGAEADKFSSGVVGVLAGSEGYPGAAVLAVGAAVRLRPGLVRYAGSQRASVLARWPEVVASDGPSTAGRVQAWLAGPGMGTDGAALRHLMTVLAADVPVLVDADGLTLLSANRSLLAARRRSGRPLLLTPHAGEFGRLWPELDVSQRVSAARAAAARSGAYVLLKGARTVICAPDGRTAINTLATPWLATAGSGDVLSGIIGSLLATGADPFEAAAAGACLHGLAGRAAERSGMSGAQALWDHLGPQVGR